MKKNTGKIIIDHLLPGQSTTQPLVTTVALQSKSSIQAVYKSLRLLRKEGVVMVHNKHASLSLIWIHRELERFRFAEYSHYANKDLSSSLSKDRTKVSFKFTTISELDLFWTHSYTILAKQLDSTIPRYMLTPHDFFLYAREETDTFWMSINITKEHTTRLVLTHPYPADKLATKLRKQRKDSPFEFLFDENPLKQPSHVYINLLGPYIFKGTFDIHISKNLESIIERIHKLPPQQEELEALDLILHEKGNFTLSIERSEARANKARNKLDKYFQKHPCKEV